MLSPKMKTVDQYLDSLKARNVRLFVRGELVKDPVDHPLVAPSVRTVAETYRLAHEPEHRELFTAHSRFIDAPVNRVTHIFEAPDDLTSASRSRLANRCAFCASFKG